MYMDYSGLWKLLINRCMTKSDLMEMTGLSSRVISKLSKNETVTTDTIARICEVLQCGVGDIMECADDDRMSVYAAYRHFGKTVGENELYKTVAFTHMKREYQVYVTKASATKATRIECRPDGAVYMIQYHLLSGGIDPTPTESVLIKPRMIKNITEIVLIRGKPGVICGLDEGIFVSSRGIPKSEDFVYVMSESAFKLFRPVE